MKTRILFLAALLFSAHVFAQSAVWQVRKGDRSLYLGGSVHTLRASDFPLPVEFDRAFENSSILVLETDLEELSRPDSLQKLLPYITLPAGKTLQTELSPRAFQSFEEKCRELGVPVASLSSMTPFMAIVALTGVQFQQMGFLSGVDQHYQERARKEGKKQIFLESVIDQIRLLDGENEEFLQQSLKELGPEMKKIVTTLVAEWRRGELAENEKLIREMKASAPRFHRRIFAERNRAWLKKIKEYLDTPETEFFLVGFGHLVSDDGLLKGLRDQGYEVIQLR
ncbi:MAG: TraB/GumN family protein [Zoogloeaceae bacterium]|jgi:uncharacterized protein YbaP (TraB family)|nr:TraB/GumN family protein [Zoogloeaceae bacterium]